MRHSSLAAIAQHFRAVLSHAETSLSLLERNLEGEAQPHDRLLLGLARSKVSDLHALSSDLCALYEYGHGRVLGRTAPSTCLRMAMQRAAEMVRCHGGMLTINCPHDVAVSLPPSPSEALFRCLFRSLRLDGVPIARVDTQQWGTNVHVSVAAPRSEQPPGPDVEPPLPAPMFDVMVDMVPPEIELTDDSDAGAYRYHIRFPVADNAPCPDTSSG